MTSCFDTIQDYGLRAIGIGERLLPKAISRYANNLC